ncbi:hypothetical protein SO802_028017 [Lithocarpus litseifolius]|uniref:Senescence domain-containing protein n=1 Tax=Lithocarpus litseifolius TaxID=425828 RepID=A0AAW2BQK6_9ROSI
MTEKMASGVLSGVVKVSGFFTTSIVNSKVRKEYFSLLPGEIVLASLDGFSRVCDAVEVAGRNIMSTTSIVTTRLVSQRYGEQAAQVTNEGLEAAGHSIGMENKQHVANEGLDAAGHAFGTAWAVFKIRKAFNPKSILKPTTLKRLLKQFLLH